MSRARRERGAGGGRGTEVEGARRWKGHGCGRGTEVEGARRWDEHAALHYRAQTVCACVLHRPRAHTHLARCEHSSPKQSDPAMHNVEIAVDCEFSRGEDQRRQRESNLCKRTGGHHENVKAQHRAARSAAHCHRRGIACGATRNNGWADPEALQNVRREAGSPALGIRSPHP